MKSQLVLLVSLLGDTSVLGFSVYLHLCTTNVAAFGAVGKSRWGVPEIRRVEYQDIVIRAYTDKNSEGPGSAAQDFVSLTASKTIHRYKVGVDMRSTSLQSNEMTMPPPNTKTLWVNTEGNGDRFVDRGENSSPVMRRTVNKFPANVPATPFFETTRVKSSVSKNTVAGDKVVYVGQARPRGEMTPGDLKEYDVKASLRATEMSQARRLAQRTTKGQESDKEIELLQELSDVSPVVEEKDLDMNLPATYVLQERMVHP